MFEDFHSLPNRFPVTLYASRKSVAKWVKISCCCWCCCQCYCFSRFSCCCRLLSPRIYTHSISQGDNVSYFGYGWEMRSKQFSQKVVNRLRTSVSSFHVCVTYCAIGVMCGWWYHSTVTNTPTQASKRIINGKLFQSSLSTKRHIIIKPRKANDIRRCRKIESHTR